MSALGQKQTFAPQNVMSALPLKADMCVALAYVCFGPQADIVAGVQVRAFQGNKCQFRLAIDDKLLLVTQGGDPKHDRGSL
jgi:hypothetical protein